MTEHTPLVEINDLAIKFGAHTAVNNVTMDIGRGRIMGLVGESGSGKSTIANAIIGLLPHAAQISNGSLRFDGRDLLSFTAQDWGKIRGKDVAYVSQDPMSALNPVLRIGEQMLDIQHLSDQSNTEKLANASAALEQVRMPQAQARLSMYPHELSGGQKQRVCIAMAMQTLCFCPPDSSWGYILRRACAWGILTCSSAADAFASFSVLLWSLKCWMSNICSPIRRTGFNALIGSWDT